MNKVIVTGGAGFIGSHLLDLLIADGHEVHVIDNFSYGKKEYLPDSPRLFLHEGDILDKDKLEKIVGETGPSAIYHLAALHHIPTCEQKPAEALRINIEGTQNVLDVAKDVDSLEKIVFASSGAVYDIVDEPLLEDSTPTVPFDIYSVSKLSGEYQMRLWANKYKKKAYVARIFNTIGGRETNDHLIPDIIVQMLAGKKEIELGNLEPKRSYIDARDTSAGLYSIGKLQSEKLFDVFNVGREDEFNVKEIVDMLADASGIPLQVIQAASRIRKVDRKKQQASLEKITSATGWKPVHTVAEGVSYAYRFARENRSR